MPVIVSAGTDPPMPAATAASVRALPGTRGQHLAHADHVDQDAGTLAFSRAPSWR